jgi:hypothetical protein
VSAYITVLTPTTFKLNGVTAHGTGTGGTATRYFSGLYGQNLAAGGSNPWNANIQVLEDGSSAIIQDTLFMLDLNNTTTSITNEALGPLGPNIVGLQVKENSSGAITAITSDGLTSLSPSGLFSVYTEVSSNFGGGMGVRAPGGYRADIEVVDGSLSQLELTDGASTGITLEISPGIATVNVLGPSGSTSVNATQITVSVGLDQSVLTQNALTVGNGANSILNKSGISLAGGAVVVDSSHLTFTSLPAVTIAGNVGQSVTLPLAKITPGGTNGSATYVAGWLVSSVAPT